MMTTWGRRVSERRRSGTNGGMTGSAAAFWHRAESAVTSPWAKMLAVVVAALVLLPMMLSMFDGHSSAARADDGDGGGDSNDTKNSLSFYNLSSDLSSFLSDGRSPDNADGVDAAWTTVSGSSSPGSAGSLLGFGKSSWLSSLLSQSSTNTAYSTFADSTTAGGDKGASFSGMKDYAHYGASLSALGFDSTSPGLGTDYLALLGAGIILGLYVLAAFVDVVFNGVLHVLSFLSPYNLFTAAVKMTNPAYADALTGGQAPPGALGDIAQWIGKWYVVLTSISWAVTIPLFVAFFVMGLLLWRNMNRGAAIKKLIVRVLFIGLGLPMFGFLYSATLNSVSTSGGGDFGTNASTQVVLSTYVDFESWSMNKRLAVPSGATIEWDNKTNSPSGVSVANARSTAMKINELSNPNWQNAGDMAYDNGGLSNNYEHVGSIPAAGYTDVTGLLFTAMSGKHVPASQFESSLKGKLSDSHVNKDKVKAWFEDFSSDKAGDIKGQDGASKIKANAIIYTTGGLQRNWNPSTGITKFSTKDPTTDCYQLAYTGSDANPAPTGCNLAPLAMYNYLNTTFGSTSLTVYSPHNATSDATQPQHLAVSQVGNGFFTSFVYWLNSAMLLLSFIIIGYAYAFGLLVSNIKHAVQLVTAVPFATLGAMNAIAKVILYAVVMVLEVIVVVYLYQIVQAFMLTVPDLFEKTISDAVNKSTTNDWMQGIASFTATVMALISIIALMFLTVTAVRLRGVVIKAINEIVTKLVEKLTESGMTPPHMTPAGAGAGMGGALAGAAGIAGANRLMAARRPNAAGTGMPTLTGGPNAGQTGDPTGGSNGPDGGPKDPTGGPNVLPQAPGNVLAPVESEENSDEGGPKELVPGMAPDAPEVTTGLGDGDSSNQEDTDREIAKQIEANGGQLPVPAQGEGDASGTETGPDGAPVSAQGNGRQDSALDTAVDSMEQSADDYRKADKARVGAVGDTVKGGGEVAAGATRMAGGDVRGGTEQLSQGTRDLGQGKQKQDRANAYTHRAGNTDPVAAREQRPAAQSQQPQQSAPRPIGQRPPSAPQQRPVPQQPAPRPAAPRSSQTSASQQARSPQTPTHEAPPQQKAKKSLFSKKKKEGENPTR